MLSFVPAVLSTLNDSDKGLLVFDDKISFKYWQSRVLLAVEQLHEGLDVGT